MRLNIAMNSANELLIALINRGYTVLRQISADYGSSKGANTYQELQDNKRYEDCINAWATDVVAELQRIFPTELEANIFLNPEIPFGAVSGDYFVPEYGIEFQTPPARCADHSVTGTHHKQITHDCGSGEDSASGVELPKNFGIG